MCSLLLKMLLGWLIAMLIIGYMISVQYKHHPKALFYLFFTEMWERFSYYGMRALLILYMTKGLLMGDAVSTGVYGTYVALAYTMPVIGGMLSERFLGLKNAIIIGALLMALGHFGMAVETPWMFFASLGLIAMGNGFFKPNISPLVGKFYFEKDPRRDSGFTIFYMGINAGAFLAPLTCGFIGETYGWHYGFGVAGVGMLVGLAVFMIADFNKIFEDKGMPPLSSAESKTPKLIIYGCLALAVPLFSYIIQNAGSSKYALWAISLIAFSYLVVLTLKEKGKSRERMFSIVIMFLCAVVFWTFFELAASVLTLYTDRNIDRSITTGFLQKIFCGEIKTSEFQSINPFFIILLAPLFSKLWERWPVSSGVKFSLALFQLAFGFMVLVIGARYANADGFVPMIFMVLGYLFFTTGELCLSPIGMSLVTKLSPANIVATVMGVWWLSVTFAGLIGAEIGKWTSIENVGSIKANALQSLGLYTHAFSWIAITTTIAGLLLLLLVRPLKRWMEE